MSSTHLGRGRRAAALRRLSSIGLCVAGCVASAPALALTEGPLPGAVSPNTLTLPDSPGSVRGLADPASIQVFSAQVSYHVDFELPAAAHGFGPKLGLSYAGELGNGPVGIAWHLGEISIRRTLRHGVPSYTDGDELELVGVGQGGRLAKLDDGTYRVEGQGNALKVERSHDHFVVTDASGTRYLLGATSDGREGEGEHISAWLVESVIDLGGQALHFSYGADQGRHYLERIAWGPGDVFELELVYDERADPSISYRTGARIVTARRVARAVVRSHGTTLRTYELGYDERRFSSRLASIHMTGLGGHLAMPDTSCEYTEPEPARTVVPSGVSNWILNQRGVSFFDVDGDGMSDLLQLEVGNHAYKKAGIDSFADARPLSGASGVDLAATTFLDLDGDARAELVTIVDDTWRAYRLDGETWVSLGEVAGTRGVALHAPDTVLTDVNGDGRTDVLRAKTGGVGVRLANASGLAPEVTLPPIDRSNVAVEPGAEGVRFGDVNGDGLADAVWLTDEWMKIYLGRGDGSFVAETRAFYPWHDGRVREPIGVVRPNDMLLADLDRDGLSDLVVINAANVNWFRGKPVLGTFAELRKLARPDGVETDAVVTVADANGNGSQDVIWSSPTGLRVLDLAGPTSAGMIARIENGLGAELSVSYRPSAVLSVQAEAAGQAWDKKLPLSIPVPVAMTTLPGPDEPARTIEYGVRDGFWDGGERRFGGFLLGRQASVATSAADTLIEETEYHPGLAENRVLRGLPWRVVKKDALGNVFAIQETDYEARAIEDLPDAPLLRKAVTLREELANLEGVAEPIRTVSTYEYDGQARRSVERHQGRLDLASDEKIVRREYVDNPALWVRDLVCDERVLEGDDQTLRAETLTAYGSDTELLEPCAGASFGWVRETRQRLINDTEDRIITEHSASYDSLGNPVTVTESGVTRELGYDSERIHVTSEALPAANLAWSAGWDETRELLVSLTDPNGDATHVTYDELGRVSSIALGNRAPHLHYTYAWEAPAPTTTTWLLDQPLDAPESPWPDGPHWRTSIAVTSGAGEERYRATRLSNERWIVSEFVARDERGQPVLRAEPFYAPSPLGASPPSGTRTQTFHHDALGRIDRQTLPNGAEKSILYRAFEQTIQEPELAPVVLTLDGSARVIRNERRIDGAPERLDVSYDADGHVLEYALLRPARAGVDGEQFVRQTYRYDTLGRMIEADDPDIGRRVLEYDDGNRLIRHANAAGQIAHFQYDVVGRLSRQGGSDDESADDVFHYDESESGSAPEGCHARGRLSSVTEPTGAVRICYDAFGRAVSRTRTVSPPGAASRTATETQLLGASGLLLGSSFDDGLELARGYDAAGRLTSVGDLWHAEALDAAGRVVGEGYGNGLRQSYEYDALGLTRDVDLSRGGPASPESIFKLHGARNSFGAPTAVTDLDEHGLDQTASYGYDTGGRLVQATQGQGALEYRFGFRYDGLQNMVERQAVGPRVLGALVGTYRYGEDGAGPRQLTSVVPPREDALPVKFEYDASGRQVLDHDARLVYDAFDRLVRVEPPPATIEQDSVQIFDAGAGGMGYSQGLGINQAGVAVGWAADSGSIYPGQIPTTAFSYSASAGFSALPQPGDTLFPYGINDSGEVVGLGGTSNVGDWVHPFRMIDGKVEFLATPGAGYAMDVNNAGQIGGVGYFVGYSGGPQLFRVEADGTTSVIGALTGDGFVGAGNASAIDFAGNLVGTSSTVGGGTRATLYTDTAGFFDMNRLLPVDSGWILAGANRSTGEFIVGTGTHDGKQAAYRYRVGEELTDLGVIEASRGVNISPGGLMIPRGVNRYGEVVGSLYDEHPFWPLYAFFYSDTVGLVDLNSLVGPEWKLELASAINDEGEITGYGEHNGVRRAFLLKIKPPRGAGGKSSAAIDYTYGHDGERTSSRSGDEVDYFFGSGTEEHAGKRVHYVTVGDRIVARLTGDAPGGADSTAPGELGERGRPLPLALFAGLCAMLLVFARALRRYGRERSVPELSLGVTLPGLRRGALTAGLAALFLAISGCDRKEPVRVERSLWQLAERLFFHAGLFVGPSLISDENGRVVEERRYDPYGEPIDAFADGLGVTVPDFEREPSNVLNKQTDRRTGFSYHGARWMAPDSARWLSPDPVVKGPNAALASAPWRLNPYQYVLSNPLLFWDPSGMQEQSLGPDDPMPMTENTFTPDQIDSYREAHNNSTRSCLGTFIDGVKGVAPDYKFKNPGHKPTLFDVIKSIQASPANVDAELVGAIGLHGVKKPVTIDRPWLVHGSKKVSVDYDSTRPSELMAHAPGDPRTRIFGISIADAYHSVQVRVEEEDGKNVFYLHDNHNRFGYGMTAHQLDDFVMYWTNQAYGFPKPGREWNLQATIWRIVPRNDPGSGTPP